MSEIIRTIGLFQCSYKKRDFFWDWYGGKDVRIDRIKKKENIKIKSEKVVVTFSSHVNTWRQQTFFYSKKQTSNQQNETVTSKL